MSCALLFICCVRSTKPLVKSTVPSPAALSGRCAGFSAVSYLQLHCSSSCLSSVSRNNGNTVGDAHDNHSFVGFRSHTRQCQTAGWRIRNRDRQRSGVDGRRPVHPGLAERRTGSTSAAESCPHRQSGLRADQKDVSRTERSLGRPEFSGLRCINLSKQPPAVTVHMETTRGKSAQRNLEHIFSTVFQSRTELYSR